MYGSSDNIDNSIQNIGDFPNGLQKNETENNKSSKSSPLTSVSSSSHKEENFQFSIYTRDDTTKKIIFGKCKVCNDESTGIHYGVSTCEGCKGFFKRTTLRKDEYCCRNKNYCIITPQNRNRCKCCRFLKCLDAGMSTENIKMGRKSREDIQKIFTIENVTQNERPVENFESYSSISNKEYNLKNEIDILISLYYNPLYNLEIEDRAKTSNFDDCVFVNHNNDSELEALKSPNRNKQNELEKLSKQVRLHYLLHNSKYLNARKQQNTNYHYGSLNDVWAGLIQLAQNNIKDMIDFVKGMPRMNEICRKDLALIVDHHNLTYYMIFNSLTHANSQGYFVLPNNIVFTRELAETIFNVEVTVSLMDFCERLNSLKLKEPELAILFALIITNYKVEITDKGILRNIYEFYLKALYYEMRLNKRDIDFFKNLSQFIGLSLKIGTLYLNNVKSKTPMGSFNF